MGKRFLRRYYLSSNFHQLKIEKKISITWLRNIFLQTTVFFHSPFIFIDFFSNLSRKVGSAFAAAKAFFVYIIVSPHHQPTAHTYYSRPDRSNRKIIISNFFFVNTIHPKGGHPPSRIRISVVFPY